MVAALTSGRPVGLDGPHVVVDRELDVHVQHAALGQQEGDVGDAAAGHAGLAAVVDALDQAGHAQDVVGHALAPLAAGLGAGQRLAQALGGGGQVAGLPGGLGELGVQVALLGGPLFLQLDHQAGRAVGAGRRLFLDDLVAQVELLVGGGGRSPSLSAAIVSTRSTVCWVEASRSAANAWRSAAKAWRAPPRRRPLGRPRRLDRGRSTRRRHDHTDGQAAEEAHEADEQRDDSHGPDPTHGV